MLHPLAGIICGALNVTTRTCLQDSNSSPVQQTIARYGTSKLQAVCYDNASNAAHCHHDAVPAAYSHQSALPPGLALIRLGAVPQDAAKGAILQLQTDVASLAKEGRRHAAQCAAEVGSRLSACNVLGGMGVADVNALVERVTMMK
jgi:hypothetical protein